MFVHYLAALKLAMVEMNHAILFSPVSSSYRSRKVGLHEWQELTRSL